MKPKAILIVVSEKVKNRLDLECQKRGLNRRDLFIEALEKFSKKHKGSYIPKHAEIDRVHSFNYSVRLLPKTINELNKLSEQLEIQRSVLVREIVCEYFSDAAS